MPEKIISLLNDSFLSKKKSIIGSRILVMGYTFKENCPDIRNTKVFDIIQILQSFNVKITLFEPLISRSEIKSVFPNITFTNTPKKSFFDSVILCVPHNKFKDLGVIRIKEFLKRDGIFFDVKSLFNKDESDIRL